VKKDNSFRCISNSNKCYKIKIRINITMNNIMRIPNKMNKIENKKKKENKLK
jgi:hypothetical protein